MKHTRGFTLIELLVSMGIFTIVITLAAGAYLIMIGVDRNTQAISTAVDSLSFSLENLSSNIRTGTHYCAEANPCPDSDSFEFVNQEGDYVTYSLTGTTIFICVQSGSFCTAASSWSAVTDPSVEVTSLTFHTTGASPTDDLQPYVTITVSGQVSAGHGKWNNFNVETSAVMRGVDL